MSHEPFSSRTTSSGTGSIPLPPDFSYEKATSELSGVGYIQYSNGSIYEGEWQHGKRNGLGVCFFPSGNVYVGCFRDGVLEGRGTMLFSSGQCFVGQFRQNEMQEGVMSSRGSERMETWRGGHRIGESPVYTPEILQRARAAFYTKVMLQLNEHMWGSRRGGAPPMQPIGEEAEASKPPDDIERLDSSAFVDSESPLVKETTQAPQTEAVPAPPGLRFRSTASSVSEAGEEDALARRLATFGSPQTVFAFASPAMNEFFSFGRFMRRFGAFAFPFLALPCIPFAPLRVTSLSQEREFVVSGASLRSDFDTPTLTLYIIAVGMLCEIAAIVIVACRVNIGKVQDGKLTLPEMVVPCVLYLVVALLCAGYTSFCRVPHGLERIDRRLTPKLSTMAASMVDARAKVCIYTCDEEGRGKVMNRHYRYRWIFFSIICGAMMGLSAPATRAGFGQPMYGRRGFDMAAALLTFFATFFFSSIVTYYVLKMTDIQREVSAKLRVLTDMAYVENHSIMNPSCHIYTPFHVDEKLDVTNLFRGFQGWYSFRSLILYASSCANHAARSVAMGVFWFAMLCTYIVSISDVLFMVEKNRTGNSRYYSTAHSYAVFVLVFWGFLLLRYMYVCATTSREMERHLFIMDVTGFYQRMKHHDAFSNETILQCRAMAAANDVRPELFNKVIYSLFVAITVLLNVAGVAAIAFQLAEVLVY